MSLITTAVNRQVAVSVGVALVVLFGALALVRTPVQLTPEVSRPEITIETTWQGASPEEVEKEIVQRQEDELKSVEGVVEMKSESQDSLGKVVLTFNPGTDMDAALLKTSNRLNQVKDIPIDADRPVISTVNTGDQAIAWFILKPKPGSHTRPIYTYQEFVEDNIKARFERVPGVARSNIFGGRERELQVVVDPAKLSAYGVTLGELIRALDSENVNISAGSFDEGKRRYVVRTLAELVTPTEVERIALKTASGKRLFVRDVATARFGFKSQTVSVRQNGDPSIAVNAQRESGANVLEVMAGLKAAAVELNDGILASEGLYLTQVYDETEYITSAIDLVQQNLWVGGTLAVVVLLLFLRSISPTLIVATSIPISLIGTFIVMGLAGRTINVVSLAGLAFAVGMVVDNAIVVLENIYRHRQMGKARRQAAIDGTSEVWGAVLSSTLTTIAVFLPILFIVEEAGQLFRDIAIAICGAVGLSLVVSVTVIPSFAARVLGAETMAADARHAHSHGPAGLFGLVEVAQRFTDWLAQTAYRISRSLPLKLLVICLFTGASLAAAVFLAPKPEYLPTGNRNLIIGLLLPPPGYNVDEFTRIGEGLEAQLAPFWERESTGPDEPPAIKNFFYVARGRQIFMGVRAKDRRRTRELIPFMQERLAKVPGMIAIVTQTSLFSRALSGGRTIDVELSGDDIGQLVAVGGRAFGAIAQAVPGAQIRPVPGLDLGNPEIHVIPDRIRLADVGVTAHELGIAVDALLDGTKASTVNVDGNELDLTVMGGKEFASRTQDFENLLIRAPGGQTLPLGALAKVSLVAGPEQINHSERQRTITLEVRPPEETPLEAAMEAIQTQVIAPFEKEGVIGRDVRVRLAGTADKLRTTFDVLKWDFALALVITYLLMAALFESFFYPLVIMFSVPLAMGGGFIGLWLVNVFIAYQALDVLTMLGFIILVGTVVNNAILIVHQTLNFMRDAGMESHDALRESVRTRVRPISMSVGTSVFGMLPLVLFPGAGSELYRGLGSVVVGGLAFSAAFTLWLVPAMFSLMMDLRQLLTGGVAKGATAG